MTDFDPAMWDIGQPHRRVMKFIMRVGSATSDEVRQALGMCRPTAAARICELAQRGYLKKSGEVRLTKGKYKATVWTTVPEKLLPQQATLSV